MVKQSEGVCIKIGLFQGNIIFLNLNYATCRYRVITFVKSWKTGRWLCQIKELLNYKES